MANMKKVSCFKNNPAFTLVEITVVVLIFGILASIALPQFSNIVENQRASAAKTILSNLHMSQRRYFIDHNNYATNIDDLDIPGATAPQGFINLTVNNTAVNVANLKRDDGTYTLSIDAAGVLHCNGGGCNKIQM